MEAYVYGQKRRLPPEFAEFFDRSRTAIVSIDMHQGHLADTPLSTSLLDLLDLADLSNFCR